jgi:hypothetical protein
VRKTALYGRHPKITAFDRNVSFPTEPGGGILKVAVNMHLRENIALRRQRARNGGPEVNCAEFPG